MAQQIKRRPSTSKGGLFFGGSLPHNVQDGLVQAGDKVRPLQEAAQGRQQLIADIEAVLATLSPSTRCWLWSLLDIRAGRVSVVIEQNARPWLSWTFLAHATGIAIEDEYRAA